MPARSRSLGAVVGTMLLTGCPAPELSDPNSADAARACLELVREAERAPDLELEDPNHARLEGGTLVYFEVVPTGRFYECEFTFDRDAQTHTAHAVREVDGLVP